MMDDMEMLARCEKAWKQAQSSGKKCRVYSRTVGHTKPAPLFFSSSISWQSRDSKQREASDSINHIEIL